MMLVRGRGGRGRGSSVSERGEGEGGGQVFERFCEREKETIFTVQYHNRSLKQQTFH